MDGVWGWLITFSDFIEHHIGAITAIIAAAAVVQWRETRKTGERQLRAYVLNFSANLFDGSTMPQAFVDRSDQPGVSLVLKNHGQTPAYRVRHVCEIVIAPVSNESRMFVPPGLNDPGFVLGPDATSSMAKWLNRPITPQEQAAIVGGGMAIYVFGRIEYLDAFKKPRWSTYRLRHCGNAWPPIVMHSTGPASVAMDFCPDGTDAN
jgi:hypothetical protein